MVLNENFCPVILSGNVNINTKNRNILKPKLSNLATHPRRMYYIRGSQPVVRRNVSGGTREWCEQHAIKSFCTHEQWARKHYSAACPCMSGGVTAPGAGRRELSYPSSSKEHTINNFPCAYILSPHNASDCAMFICCCNGSLWVL